MHSTYDSVQEQTGVFAGKGGFDITVGEHTQLNGAVIGSTATADKNTLDTGTLGFGNIENQAEYEVEHQSVGISSGGSIGGQFAGNMANGLLTGVNGSGSASSTTQSAVSEGTITIRDKDRQAQNVEELSRDVEHVNQTLSPIFDKEKEQNRLKEAQLIGEIGSQVGDIVRTQGQIEATRAANEKMQNVTPKDRETAKAQWEKANPGKTATAEDINGQIYQTAYNKAFNESGYGTGGKFQQAVQAATAAVQGLAGGNMAQAVSGAAAPYLAEQIHKLTQGNPEAQAMAHAVVGAVVAQASGNSGLAGAAGAVTGELMAQLVMEQLYPGKKVSELSESEKQTISMLGTLAAGLAGGVAGDSTANAVAGAQTGKSSAENNALNATDEKKRQDAKWSLPYLDGEKKAQAEKLINDLNAKDKAFDAALDAACKGLSSAACQGMRQELAAMAKSYDEQLDGQYIGSMRSVYAAGAEQVDSLMWQYATADAKAQREADVQRIAANWGVSTDTAATLYDGMTAVHGIAVIGGAVYGMKGPSTVTVYRVEGTPNTRILIGDNGKVTITGNTTLYLNFGDKARALEFFEKRGTQNMDGATIKTFEVPNSVLDDLRKTAVKESVARLPENKGKPVIADPTKAKDQYGIRPEKLKELQDKIIQGTGKNAGN